MHIALIDPSEFTPPYDAALAKGLSAVGHRVAMIGQAGGSLADDPALEHVGHFYRPLATPWGRRLSGAAVRTVKGGLHALDLATLPGLLRRLQVDVVHLQWLPLPLIDGVFVQRLRSVAPVVLTVHDTLPFNGAEPWLMSAGLDRVLHGVDAIICHTAQGRRHLLQQGVAPHRLHVVPHGLLGTTMETPAAPPGERIRLLQLGNIKPYKGVDVLLAALRHLEPRERARLDVHVAGRPYVDTQALEAQRRANDLGDCVRFDFDFLTEAMMELLVARANALVFPYRHIDASGVLMQAVAASKPVLASKIGVFDELLQDGKQGLLVPPGDPDALASALRQLVAAPERLLEMSRRMGALRDGLPGWPEIGRQTARIYAAAHAAWSTEAATRPRAVQETS